LHAVTVIQVALLLKMDHGTVGC